jgi:uncharacterized protein YbcI
MMLKPNAMQIIEGFTRRVQALERDYLGHGDTQVEVYLVDDMALVRLRGVLTPAELRLAESREGRSLVKETQRRLFETARPMIEDMVRDVTGARLVSLHTDMSTSTGERVIVLVVDTCFDV